MTITAGGNTTVTTVGPGGAAFGGQLPPLTMVSPSELPDYKPAFSPGSTRADAGAALRAMVQNLCAPSEAPSSPVVNHMR